VLLMVSTFAHKEKQQYSYDSGRPFGARLFSITSEIKGPVIAVVSLDGKKSTAELLRLKKGVQITVKSQNPAISAV
jgi:hypothetical protein